MTIRLASLDMAGTTIDEGGTVYAVLRDTVEEATGRTIPDDVLARWSGTSKYEAIIGIIGELGAREDPDAVYAEFQVALDDAYADEPPVLLPGVDEAVQRLRDGGVKVALQTGYARDVAERLLELVDWVVGEDIDALITSDEVAASRPAPYLIFRSMEATGIRDVREVLVAGDTPNDLRAGIASGAGMVVGVLTGAGSADELGRDPHTHLLRSITELPGLVLPTRLASPALV